jgi:MFS family permease
MNRNLLILTMAQALGLAAAPMIVLVGGIVGQDLAPRPSWSTLPVATMIIGGAAGSVPAALLMSRVGRRTGFICGSLLALVASLLAIKAIDSANFSWFCLATLGIGGNLAFVQQYRFAAVESVEPGLVGRAVSMVLLGGIIAAFLGPEIVKHSREWLALGAYSGTFAALAGLSALSLILHSGLKFAPLPLPATTGKAGRPLGLIVRQPLFITAVLAGLVSYAGMTLIMTATPVSMRIIDGFSLDETAWVIQSHVMAMYIPSLFSGLLIDRFGLSPVMIAGIVIMAACGLVAQIDHHLSHYWLGLVLLGVGWNFLFVSATALLSRGYRPEERFRAQGFNDLMVYSFQAASSFGAGVLIFSSGWQLVNLSILPVLLVMLGVVLKMRHRIDQR